MPGIEPGGVVLGETAGHQPASANYKDARRLRVRGGGGYLTRSRYFKLRHRDGLALLGRGRFALKYLPAV